MVPGTGRILADLKMYTDLSTHFLRGMMIELNQEKMPTKKSLKLLGKQYKLYLKYRFGSQTIGEPHIYWYAHLHIGDIGAPPPYIYAPQKKYSLPPIIYRRVPNLLTLWQNS